MIDITGLDKPRILKALYNNSKPQGMGLLHFEPRDMTDEEATALLVDNSYFDYCKGRVMKVDLSGDKLKTWLYDRDNGSGAACVAISKEFGRDFTDASE